MGTQLKVIQSVIPRASPRASYTRQLMNWTEWGGVGITPGNQILVTDHGLIGFSDLGLTQA